MVPSWITPGMREARSQFRRVNGHLHLPALRATLDQTIATAITAITPPTDEDAASSPVRSPPKFHGERDDPHLSTAAIDGNSRPGSCAAISPFPKLFRSDSDICSMFAETDNSSSR
jgi:hypothetical protein